MSAALDATEEIERKFRPATPITDEEFGALPFEIVQTSDIEQAYVALDGDVEVRTRKIRNVITNHTRAVLTIKGKSGGDDGDDDDGLVRTEVEFGITTDAHAALVNLARGRVVSKTRTTFLLEDGKTTAEWDRHHRDGAQFFEVEFASRASAGAFEVPSCFGDDVTADRSVKNKAIAKRNAALVTAAT